MAWQRAPGSPLSNLRHEAVERHEVRADTAHELQGPLAAPSGLHPAPRLLEDFGEDLPSASVILGDEHLRFSSSLHWPAPAAGSRSSSWLTEPVSLVAWRTVGALERRSSR